MQPNHKLIVTGTGRAGTTFLVRLFTELGLDTGYTRDNWREDFFPHCAAGLERNLSDTNTPYVVKHPDLCVTLPAILASGRIVIDHAVVPVRELEAAALSRVRIGGANGNVPGGLLGTDLPAQQKAILAERFYCLVHTLIAHDIPHTFVHFPRCVEDADYLFSKLAPLLPNIDRTRFIAAFGRVADPALVHTFASGAVPLGDGAKFFAAQKHARRRRRLRRAAAAFVLSAATVALVAAVRFGFFDLAKFVR